MKTLENKKIKMWKMSFGGRLSAWVYTEEDIYNCPDSFAVFNCNGDFVEACNMEVKAKVLIQELDENFGKKGAYYKKAKIVVPYEKQ